MSSQEALQSALHPSATIAEAAYRAADHPTCCNGMKVNFLFVIEDGARAVWQCKTCKEVIVR